ncbi:MAG: alpha/beta hydrolase [Stappiaceae bacterium]
MSNVLDFKEQLDNATFSGWQAGSGPPFMCLHAGVADNRMFTGLQEGLGAQFSLLSYDRRGYGETATQDVPFSHMRDFEALLDRRTIDRAVLLGCSQGGRIAIDYALSNPDRVKALILIASALSGAPASEDPIDIQPLIEALDIAEEAEDWDEVNRIEAHMWLDGPRSTEGRISGPTRDLFLDMNGIALQHPELTQRSDPPSALERLSDLEMPVLLLQGDLDFPDILERQKMMANSIRGARSVTCPGTAHMLPMENPAFVVNQSLSFCQDNALI